MFRRSTPKAAVLGLSFAAFALASGCANTQNKQSAATPAADANVPAIVKQVKQQPSTISGGGMIYELFVGNHFAARYNEKAKELKLTDFSGNGSCEFDETGVLKVPADAKSSYRDYCSQLSTNTMDFLKQ